MSPFLPHIDNEKQFSLIRNKLFGQSTTLQIPATIDTTIVNDNNYSTAASTFQLTTSNKTKPNENKSYQNILIIHYKHEKRLHSFKRDLHQVHDKIFNNTPVQYLTLIVGNKNRRDARHELIRKRPKRLILKNIMNKRKEPIPHPIKQTFKNCQSIFSFFVGKRRAKQTNSNPTGGHIPSNNSN